MDKSLAKEDILKLIDKYELVKSAGKIKSYTEEETKKDFIMPLFRALGWDVENKNEVSAEEHEISSGRVDYGFYINRRVKFYLEAKSLKADLNLEEFAKQAIRYSFNRGVTWAILTDFEGIKIFNAQSPSKYLGDKLYLNIKYSEYTDRFEELWLLSKESFLEDKIDTEAIKAGKKIEKIPITELLSQDLNECRKLLTEQLEKWNTQVPKDLLDEGVQKLLDRIVFIKVAEDRKIENNVFLPLINQWRLLTGPNKPTLYQSMTKKFRELDATYNSSLFSPHPFEEWEEEGNALEKVLKILNGEEGYYEYDFSVLPADVLGSVYENYLGYKLSQSKKGLTLDKSAGKRKEQGIYYTPTFIVDYIVKNALKPVLDNCKSVNDLKRIKVLDPACGSGSFLIKALEVIAEKYKEFNYEVSEFTKFQILTENLFGVDLDQQAVEITKLNLLINSFQQREMLPSLDKNIKNGNSLISGSDEQLRNYFGENFKDKKPLNWTEAFPNIFKQGGFDAIIGNPPWVSLKGKQKSENIDEVETKFYLESFKSNKYRPNLFEIFIIKSLELLKNNGTLSFIVPDRLCENEQFVYLRKRILENYLIKNLWFRVNFPGIIGDTIVFVIEKTVPEDNYIYISEYPNTKSIAFPQKAFSDTEDKKFYHIPEMIYTLFKKIINKSKPLEFYVHSSVGFIGAKGTITKNKENNLQIEVLKGENVIRYGTEGVYYFEFKKDNLAGGTQDELKLGAPSKIFLRKTGTNLIATYGIGTIFSEQSLYFLYGATEEVMLFLLGIINSRLMNTYYHFFAITNRDSTPQLKKTDLDKFPIASPTKDQISLVSILTEKILRLSLELKQYEKNSNNWKDLKSEIEKTDEKINDEIYKIYKLTPEEIITIEESLAQWNVGLQKADEE